MITICMYWIHFVSFNQYIIVMNTSLWIHLSIIANIIVRPEFSIKYLHTSKYFRSEIIGNIFIRLFHKKSMHTLFFSCLSLNSFNRLKFGQATYLLLDDKWSIKRSQLYSSIWISWYIHQSINCIDFYNYKTLYKKGKKQ